MNVSACANGNARNEDFAGPLVRRLERFVMLGAADRNLIDSLPQRRQLHTPGEEFCVQDEPARAPRLILSGWACRMRVLADGRRQIFSFLIPGDLLCFSSREDVLSLSTTAAITPMETLAAGSLLAVMQEREHAGPLAEALQQAERAEQLMLFDHLVRLGRLTAYERTAHLLLELQYRLQVAGLGGERFPLPLTQELLADALGLSLVHINRTLKQLRRDRLLILDHGAAELPDLERLRGIARFTPPYEAEVPELHALAR